MDDAIVTHQSRSATVRLLWSRFSWRHWCIAPGQTAMLILILALGVAVYLSIRLANRAAVAGFETFTDAVTGQSDFVVEPPAGALDESVLREIRTALAGEPVTLVPVVETTASRPRHDSRQPTHGRESFRVIGIDLVATGNLMEGRMRQGSFLSGDATPSRAPPRTIKDILGSANLVWISPDLAKDEGIATDSTFEIVVDEDVIPMIVAGTIPVVEGLPRPSRSMLIVDLPEAQQLARRPGRIDRIEVVVPHGPEIAARRDFVRRTLVTMAHGRWDVSTPASRRETGETMTAAFRLNLTVLSLLALLVGLLLILQALDGAVVRRRQEIAVLRSLGVEEGAIRFAWLLEASAIGVIGGTIGAFLGWGAAQFAVRMVARTVNQLYFATTTHAAAIHWDEFFGAIALGVTASVAAGWIPARAAASTPPAQMLGRGRIEPGLALLRSSLAGVALVAAGVILYFAPPLRTHEVVNFPLAGYAAAACWIFGAGILGATLLRPLALSARKLGARLPMLRVALGHLQHPTGRHRLAVAGLVTAVGMTAGMIVLVASFETTLRDWISRSLRADLFVQSDAAQNASSRNRLHPETWRRLISDTEVAGAELFQSHPIRLDGRPTFLNGFGYVGDVPGKNLPWIAGPRIAPDQLATTANGAYVSESFSERFGVRLGGRVTVPTPAGPRVLEILGVFADYGSDRGSVLVPRRQLASWFSDDALINAAIHLKPGVDEQSVIDRWTDEFPGLRVMSNKTLRGQILTIFHQTFAITYVLEFIGVIVAVAGLALTLASMLIDRREELTTLRALGLTHREIAQTSAWEGAATALSGAVAGLLLSVVLGLLLVFVINKQSYGWTLQFIVPAGPLALLLLVVVVTGTLVAWLVGRWGASLPADQEE